MRNAARGVVCRAVLVGIMALAASVAGASSNYDEMLRYLEDHPAHRAVDGVVEGSAAKDFTAPLVVPGADWRNDGGDTGGYRFWFSNGGPSSDGSTTVCMMAPLYIGEGQTVSEFWITAVDNDATYDLTVYFMQCAHATGTVSSITSVATTGASATPQSAGDYSLNFTASWQYSYYATACFPATSSIYLLSTRVWY